MNICDKQNALYVMQSAEIYVDIYLLKLVGKKSKSLFALFVRAFVQWSPNVVSKIFFYLIKI